MKTLLTLLLSSFALVLSSFAAKPNVLFIAVDDLRPDLACYGAVQMKTPRFDKLASQGLLFERAYCQVAVCNPSRASILSGARPDTTGVLDNQHFMRPQMPDVISLPQHFKNNGWHSVSLGKVYHHSEREPGDDPLSWSEPPWYRGNPAPGWFAKSSLDYVNALKKLPKDQQPALMRGPPFEASDTSDDVHPDGQTALKAIETLRRLKAQGQPFFLGVGFVKPHLPFNCPQKYWDLYPADTIQLPANYARRTDVPAPALLDPYELRSYGTVPPDGEPIPDEMALNLIRGYRACVSFMDAQLGRVLDELDALGLADSTIVIVWGDHGYHLGEHGLFTKMTNFELGTHVPLIVRVPGQKTAGQKTRALVELVDLYPTLAELAGLPLPAHLEGTSFAPLLAEPARPWKKAAFSQYLRKGGPKLMGKGPLAFDGRSIRTDRWRYTEWKDPKGQPLGAELYDHQSDPAENTNLANDPTHAETRSQLASQLKAGWQAARPNSP
jgi:arylsulfatase A-like enzyme